MNEIRVSGPVSYPGTIDDLFDRFWRSPFGKTVIEATNESENFAEEIQSMMGFIEDGIRAFRQSGVELREAVEVEAALTRGRTFDELIQGGSYPLIPESLSPRPFSNLPPGGGGGSDAEGSVARI